MIYSASMECWNFGMVERWLEETISLELLSYPLFHYSIVPIVSEVKQLDLSPFSFHSGMMAEF